MQRPGSVPAERSSWEVTEVTRVLKNLLLGLSSTKVDERGRGVIQMLEETSSAGHMGSPVA